MTPLVSVITPTTTRRPAPPVPADGCRDLLYRLFQTLSEVVFELAGLDEPDGRRYRFRAEEVKQTAFRLDGVLEPPDTQR